MTLSIGAIRDIDDAARTVGAHPSASARIDWSLTETGRSAVVVLIMTYDLSPPGGLSRALSTRHRLAVVRMAGKRGRPEWTRGRVEEQAARLADDARSRLAREVDRRRAIDSLGPVAAVPA